MSIPKRSEVPVEFTWDVSAIFESEAAWEEALAKIPSYAEQLAAFRGHLGDSAEKLLAFFRLGDEIEQLRSSLIVPFDISDNFPCSEVYSIRN